MAIDPKEGLFEHTGFRGLRNNVDAGAFDLGDLATALNVDIDDELELHRRKGFSAAVLSGSYHSLWSAGSFCLAAKVTDLVYITPALSSTVVRSGLTANLPVSYTAVADRVFYANGSENGVVQNGVNRTWGITPPLAPVLTATGGALRPGKYQVSLVYIRNDGQESGAPRAEVIELAATGGFTVGVQASADPTVSYIAVYVSYNDGETLYRYAVIANAAASYPVTVAQQGSVALQTQFLTSPPAGEHVGYYNGFGLVAKGNRLYPSQVYAPELFDLRESIPFLDHISMVAPVDEGVWIGTDSQVIFLSGDVPARWIFRVKADYGVTPGGLAYGDGEILDPATRGVRVAFFQTKRGMCAGLPSGQFMNLTEERFAIPAMDRAAGIVRRHRGINQYLVTLQGTEVAGNSFS